MLAAIMTRKRIVRSLGDIFGIPSAAAIVQPMTPYGGLAAAYVVMFRVITVYCLGAPKATLSFVNSHVAAMIRLQWLTGMRSGEVCRMSMVDLDMTGELWIYKPRLHKTANLGHARIVPLGPQAQAVIRPFLKAVPTAYLFSPAEAEAERRAVVHASRKTPLSCGNRPGTHVQKRPKKRAGACYSPDSYKGAIDYAIRKANIARAAALGVAVADLAGAERVEHWHPHQLRHAAATRIRKQYGLEAARAVLGHKSLAITEVYAERDHARVEEIARRVG